MRLCACIQACMKTAPPTHSSCFALSILSLFVSTSLLEDMYRETLRETIKESDAYATSAEQLNAMVWPSRGSPHARLTLVQVMRQMDERIEEKKHLFRTNYCVVQALQHELHILDEVVVGVRVPCIA